MLDTLSYEFIEGDEEKMELKNKYEKLKLDYNIIKKKYINSLNNIYQLEINNSYLNDLLEQKETNKNKTNKTNKTNKN